MVKLRDIVNEIHQEENLDELNLKKAAAIGAMGLATLGSPKTASGQSFKGLKDKFKAGVTAVQNKIKPQQKTDTVYVKKDAPLALAKFKDSKGVGYGYAESRDEQMAMDMARMNATADLMKKMGKTQMTVGVEEKDMKLYQNADGTYAAEMLVVAGGIEEGIDDPVKPGILKDRLGKLSCTRVKAAKAKLKDKGTHYAKALQRYLNYHC
jgi:hypothetical protein